MTHQEIKAKTYRRYCKVATQHISGNILLKRLAIILGIITAFVGGNAMAFDTYTYRYRLTVEIDTPDGVKSGSSVYEVQTKTFPRWMTLGNTDNSTKFSGEAVVVDLGDDKKVFTIMDSGFEVLAAYVFLNAEQHSVNRVTSAQKLSKMQGRKTGLISEYIPTLITFRDNNDPSTLVGLYATKVWKDNPPYKETSENLASYFGGGFALSQITIEVTDAPVTRKILEILPWLPNHKGSLSRDSNNNIIRSVSASDMWRQ